jgi:hypothetical protein
VPLTTQQADKELFDQYNQWKFGYVRVSNAPIGCSQISARTAMSLRTKWVPGSPPNTWAQTQTTGFRLKDSTVRWLTRSVSGGVDVVDFHAIWRGKGRLLPFYNTSKLFRSNAFLTQSIH